MCPGLTDPVSIPLCHFPLGPTPRLYILQMAKTEIKSKEAKMKAAMSGGKTKRKVRPLREKRGREEREGDGGDKG